MIDIKNLEKPDVLSMPSYETLVAENTALLQQLIPDYQPLESDPYMLLVESFSYRELYLRAEFNNRLSGLLLIYAQGNNLDTVAASYYGLNRLTDETDKAFRARILASLDGYSTAGSIESYEFHTRSVSAIIDDVLVFSPEKGSVKVVIASFNKEITPELMAAVEEKLNSKKVRPITDLVQVDVATEKPVEVNANVVIFNIDDQNSITQKIMENFSGQLNIGEDLTHSQMIRHCHVNGVYKITLTNHDADVQCGETEIIKIVGIHLTFSKFES